MLPPWLLAAPMNLAGRLWHKRNQHTTKSMSMACHSHPKFTASLSRTDCESCRVVGLRQRYVLPTAGPMCCSVSPAAFLTQVCDNYIAVNDNNALLQMLQIPCFSPPQSPRANGAPKTETKISERQSIPPRSCETVPGTLLDLVRHSIHLRLHLQKNVQRLSQLQSKSQNFLI